MVIQFIGDELSRMSSVCGKRLTNYHPSLAESGRVFASGLNDFGQLGISENKSYTIV
jgi:alpha-tubulin suppressor-like RCC1 family protein